MVIIADSGSTKCDWLLINGKDPIETKTMGFNPFFHSKNLIVSELGKNDVLSECRAAVQHIYFYGAGCSSDERNAIVRDALAQFFAEANAVVVDHDLTGAALATCGDDEGIACILGTGSNSCYFDGTKVSEKIPALGYILGDEGSGSYFGKRLLSDFLYQRMPEDLRKAFYHQYSVSKEEIFLNVYGRSNPNVYLASFMRFMAENRLHPYINEIILKGLRHFADIHIMCYEQVTGVKVHFVGSIAHYFHEELHTVAKELGFEIGNIVKKPIHPLAEYHVLQMAGNHKV